MLSIFRTRETSTTDAANFALSITRITNYFKHNLADKNPPAREFANVVKALWSLIITIYTTRWNFLSIEDKSIHKLMSEKILSRYLKLRLLNEKAAEKSSFSFSSTSLPPNVIVSSPIATFAATSPLSTSVAPQKISKPSNMKKSYAQASKTNILSNVKDVL